MSVLVTTTDGYHIFPSSGKQLRSLEGHRVECFTPGAGGTFLAVIDRHEVWSHGSDGEWTPLAKKLGLQAVAVYGGADIDRQVAKLRKGVDLIIATPGRVGDRTPARRAGPAGDDECRMRV